MSALAQEDREFLDRLRAELAEPVKLPLTIYERLLDEQRAARIDEAEARARQADYDPALEVQRIEIAKHNGYEAMEKAHRQHRREVSKARAIARRARRDAE